MEPPKEPKTETKFILTDPVTATVFGKMIGCGLNAVKAMFGEKLTEGVSYLKDGRTILIDPIKAREELRATVNPKTCKNPKLLEFLGLAKDEVAPERKTKDAIDAMTDPTVRSELMKSELRRSLLEEKVLEGTYIDKEKVNKNLEAVGIEIRNAFTGISARVTPQVRAATNDRDAENIIHQAIEDVLISLSALADRDLTV